MSDPPSPLPGENNRFATTRWTLVLAAGRKSSPQAQQALETLCGEYWYPLYAYVRRKGHSIEEAQDLTQSFFAHLLEKEALQVADPQRGKFRSFLLSSLNHFLTNQWRRETAQKRGGGRQIVSLDFDEGEKRYRLEPADPATPETIFQRRWAMTLLEKAISQLQQDYRSSGRENLFEQLKGFLGGGDNVPYNEIAQQLEMTEGAVKVAVHRLRQRCRQALRDEIGQTVAAPEEIDEELRQLFAAIGS